MNIRLSHLYIAAIGGTLLFCFGVIISYFFVSQTPNNALADRTLSGIGGERQNSVPFFTVDKRANGLKSSSDNTPDTPIDSTLSQGKFVKITKEYVACATLNSLNSARERSGDTGEEGLFAYYTNHHSPCVIEQAGNEYFVAHVSMPQGAACVADYPSTRFCIWFPSEYLEVDTGRRPLVPGATGQWPVGQMNNDRLDRQAF